VGPRAGLDMCGKSRPHHHSILGRSIIRELTTKKTSTFNGRSTGSCICLRQDLSMSHVSLLCFYAYRLYLTCDMDKSSLRHIHDPVLLSLKVEVICYYTQIFAFSCQFSF